MRRGLPVHDTGLLQEVCFAGGCARCLRRFPRRHKGEASPGGGALLRHGGCGHALPGQEPVFLRIALHPLLAVPALCGAVRRGPKGERCDQRPRERLRTYPHGAAGSGLLRRLPAHAARRGLCGGGQAASSGAAYSLCTAHCADAGIGSGSGSAGHGASAFTTPVGSALCRQRVGRSRRVVDSVFMGLRCGVCAVSGSKRVANPLCQPPADAYDQRNHF